MRRFSTEAKVGLFVAAIILLLAWATVRVADRAAVGGRGYDVSLVIDNATGLKSKAPVELAGVAVGVVGKIDLVDSRRAKVTLRLNHAVQLPIDSRAVLRTRGFLGETYVELVPGSNDAQFLQPGESIERASATGDVNRLVDRLTDIADDVKSITKNLRTIAGGEGNPPINQIVANLEEFTKAIKEVTLRNTDNVDRIANNMANLTAELHDIVVKGRKDIEDSMDRIASITGKIDRGEGTIGKLVNDEQTVNKLNESLDGLNETLGGFKHLEMELGFHSEYLTHSQDFKNYASLRLAPAPDQSVLVDLVVDPNPPPTHVEQTTDVTVGGTTTTVTTNTATIDRSRFLFSAQLAKQFYDFTVRGGLIESSGGMGLDFGHGPFDLKFSAFDFSTRFGERPHLKLLGDVNVTKNFFLVGGADDMISRQQATDYFVGAGFRFVDDDLKSLARFTGGKSLTGK